MQGLEGAAGEEAESVASWSTLDCATEAMGSLWLHPRAVGSASDFNPTGTATSWGSSLHAQMLVPREPGPPAFEYPLALPAAACMFMQCFWSTPAQVQLANKENLQGYAGGMYLGSTSADETSGTLDQSHLPNHLLAQQLSISHIWTKFKYNLSGNVGFDALEAPARLRRLIQPRRARTIPRQC